MKIEVKNRQCLVDIALQECGSVEAVFAIAERNGLAITDDLAVGQVLTFEPSDIEDKRVVAALAAGRVSPVGAADEKMLRALLVAIDPEDGSGLLEDTTDTVEPTPLTSIFTEEFDITFA